MPKTALIIEASTGFGKDASRLFTSKAWNASAVILTQEKARSSAKSAGFFTPKLADLRGRYPVIAFPLITIRKRFGARIWDARISMWIRSLMNNKSAQAPMSAFAAEEEK